MANQKEAIQKIDELILNVQTRPSSYFSSGGQTQIVNTLTTART